ncbi:MAG: type IV pilus twitching motility protein PilT [Planctomycetes bacterium]|nr:type IV pilus twitching motility protein PilT [Planctomycetota bacterium]
MPEIDKLLKMAKDIGASDLHVSVGAPPILRLHGVLRRTKHPPLSAEQSKSLIMGLLTPDQKKEFMETKELDLCYEIPEVGRFRTNVLQQRKGVDAAFRVIPSDIRSIDDLGLPSVIKTLLSFRQGLILVTGAAGTGKTTSLAAMIDYLNQTRREHIITVEDPIEILHTSKSCHVTQREVGPHTNGFSIALRAALREDPDIILVGEMRDLETMSMAITSAETGHLVLATLHTSSAPRTINRVLDVFPSRQQSMIRAMVSESLRGIMCQQLVPRADGQGRVLALEICVVTPAISNLIREQKAFQIPSQMQIGTHLGMQLLDDHLESLVKTGFITRQEAYERANDKKRFVA